MKSLVLAALFALGAVAAIVPAQAGNCTYTYGYLPNGGYGVTGINCY